LYRTVDTTTTSTGVHRLYAIWNPDEPASDLDVRTAVVTVVDKAERDGYLVIEERCGTSRS
jgi:hypothetical protein